MRKLLKAHHCYILRFFLVPSDDGVVSSVSRFAPSTFASSNIQWASLISMWEISPLFLVAMSSNLMDGLLHLWTAHEDLRFSLPSSHCDFCHVDHIFRLLVSRR